MLVAAFVAASLRLFVWPPQDPVARADAVVVLSGSRVERLPRGLAVLRRTGTPTLVISGGYDRRWRQARRLCTGRPRLRVLCFTPDPNSTRGEAEEVARIAARRGWRSVIVVSSTYHVVRARLLFRRCFRGRIAVVGAHPRLLRWIEGVPSEWTKLAVQLTFERGC